MAKENQNNVDYFYQEYCMIGMNLKQSISARVASADHAVKGFNFLVAIGFFAAKQNHQLP